MKLQEAIRILKTETEHTENRIAMELDIQAIETVLQAIEDKEKIIDRMIDYIMIHQQVKTMRKIFCKHCEINKGSAHSGIHRDCIKRYFESEE